MRETWEASYVATTLMVGDTLEQALDGVVLSSLPREADALVVELRAPQRANRAAALAKAVGPIVIALDERTLG